ncbi:hypothetical protein [Caldifermentibacillus hisashii]|uniref:hypothetical protein n=1 Tax=Caldifermentibacillus hisashii TaxID=996558 RepID=UPI003100B917
MTTSLVLVAIFGWELLNFDDEIRSRHRFEVKKALFWRRESISSPFCGKKCPILATSLVLVAILRQETHNFSDET